MIIVAIDESAGLEVSYRVLKSWELGGQRPSGACVNAGHAQDAL